MHNQEYVDTTSKQGAPAHTRMVCGAVFGVLFFLAGLAPTAHAQLKSAVQAFDEGNELYRAGDYQGAVDAYRQAIEGGYTSDALYYNLGNAWYRLDNLGQAIRYYEKARLLAPENAELLHNLEIARAKTVDQFSQLPAPAWVSWWENTIATNGGRWLFWTGFLFYLIAIGVAAYRIRTGKRNPWLRRGMTVALLLGALLLVAAFSASLQSIDALQAVILAEEVDLRTAPNEAGAIEIEIHEGLVVDVLQRNNDWIEVRLPNGATGWVPGNVAGDI